MGLRVSTLQMYESSVQKISDNTEKLFNAQEGLITRWCVVTSNMTKLNCVVKITLHRSHPTFHIGKVANQSLRIKGFVFCSKTLFSPLK